MSEVIFFVGLADFLRTNRLLANDFVERPKYSLPLEIKLKHYLLIWKRNDVLVPSTRSYRLNNTIRTSVSVKPANRHHPIAV